MRNAEVETEELIKGMNNGKVEQGKIAKYLLIRWDIVILENTGWMTETEKMKSHCGC